MMEFHQTLQTPWYREDEHFFRKNRSNLGEVGVARAKTDKLTKWKSDKN